MESIKLSSGGRMLKTQAEEGNTDMLHSPKHMKETQTSFTVLGIRGKHRRASQPLAYEGNTDKLHVLGIRGKHR